MRPKKKKSTANNPVMGDWQGTYSLKDGTKSSLAAQVIDLGKNGYKINMLAQFDTNEAALAVLHGKIEKGEIDIKGKGQSDFNDTQWQGAIENDVFTGSFSGNKSGTFELKKTVRLSATLGQKPPSETVILFDGSNLNQWDNIGGSSLGFIDLAAIVGGENCAAYLKSKIFSPKEQQVTMVLGTDDGVKVWVNGELVHSNNTSRSLIYWQDNVKFVLKQGWNVILLKVTNAMGDWSAVVRLANDKGENLPDISEQDRGLSGEKPTRKFLDKSDGYLTVWQVAGPYRQQGKNASEIFDIAFAPEDANSKDIKWKPVDRTQIEPKQARWKIVDGAMEIRPGSGWLMSKRKFKNFNLHLEFRTPFMPDSLEQSRGNSGVYLQGRYEIQILDSYGLPPSDHDTGGFYKTASPLLNACAPPMQWQSYDITFYAPVFDADGKKIKDASVTALLNGIKIHDNTVLPAPTAGAFDDKIDQPGGIWLQDHGNLVQFRNIWLIELPEKK